MNWIEYLNGLSFYAIFFLASMLLDLVGGIAKALMEGNFDAEKLPTFLITSLGYFMAWIFAELLALLPALTGITPEGWQELLADVAPKTVWGIVIVTKYGASIVKKIRFFMEVEKPEV